MSFRATISEQAEIWKAQMRAAPDEPKQQPLACPLCARELVLRWGRWSERWHVHHFTAPDCELSTHSWWGDSREEARAEFAKWVEENTEVAE